MLHPKGWLWLHYKGFYLKIGRVGAFSGRREIIVTEDHFSGSVTMVKFLNISEFGLRSVKWLKRCLLSVELF